MNIARIFTALSVAVATAGCDQGPTAEDIRATLAKPSSLSQVAELANGDNAAKRAQLVGCAKSELGSYQCDIAGLGGAVVKVRMVRMADGWSIAR